MLQFQNHNFHLKCPNMESSKRYSHNPFTQIFHLCFLLFSMTPKIQNQVIHLLKTQSKLLQTKTKQRENFKLSTKCWVSKFLRQLVRGSSNKQRTTSVWHYPQHHHQQQQQHIIVVIIITCWVSDANKLDPVLGKKLLLLLLLLLQHHHTSV